jgi:hypothetical protein
MGVLHAYVQTARLMATLGTIFVGIAFDNPHKDYKGGAEDLFVLLKDSWTAKELAELNRMRQELGLWGSSMEYWRYRQDEFPNASQTVAIRRVDAGGGKPKQSHQTEKPKAAKLRKKMQQQSKRRNRKK